MKRLLALMVVGGFMAGAAVQAETVVTNDSGRLAVNFCRDDLVHFRYAPKGEEFVPASTFVARQAIAKTDADYAPVAVHEGRLGGKVTLASAGLMVDVDERTLAITISADGKPVFKSAAAAFAAQGEGRRAAFVRDVAGKEHFLGLGNQPGTDFKSLELRDATYELWLTANNVHAIIPLWYSSNGYGVYLCSSNRGQVSFKEDYSVAMEGGEMNFYFVWGPSYKAILEKWSELAGRMHLPPLYALGLTYRGWGNFKAEDLVKVTREQQDAGLAVDVIGVEPGWHTRAYPCSFKWSDRFKDPSGFLDEMHRLGVKVNFWEHPYYTPDCPARKASEPYGIPGPDIAKMSNENMRYGFGGLVPDMTIPAARDAYWKMHEEALFNRGADGLKVDETDDWAVGRSLQVKMPSGIACNAYHNLIGTLTCNLVHERYREVYGKRTFLFSRGNWAGMQRWATSAYTDFYGFEQFVMSVIVQSCSGSYYTPEIRNRETPNDCAYMRRAEMMFLTPFPMSNEWQEDVAVTRRSKAVFDCYKKYNELHYRLVPYLYSLFREQNRTGVGVVRALPFEFAADAATYGVSDEFMLGDALLVRPVADCRRACTASIYLPRGAEWIDWWTLAAYPGGETVTYPCPADVLPLFIRAGAIIPMARYGRNTGDRLSPDVELLVVPAAEPSSFTLYEDDGISYAYEKGIYRETRIEARAKDDEVTVKLGRPQGAFQLPARSFKLKVVYRGNVMEKTVADTGAEQVVTFKVGSAKVLPRPVALPQDAVFECEAEGNVFDKVEVNRKEAKASGQGVVRNLGDKVASSFTMRNVKVAKAGIYEVELGYANGDGGARRLRVTPNGGTSLRLECPPTGPWYTGGAMSFQLELHAGMNEIRFDVAPGDGWGPDIDCLRIPPEPLVAR